MRKFLLLTALILAVLAAHLLRAQTPAPVILQATSSNAVAHPTPAPQTSTASDDTLQRLQEMQATNAGTLKKQAATLQALDDLQKAASQIKIYSKRS